MKLSIGNVWAGVDAPADELEWLQGYASYDVRRFVPGKGKYKVTTLSLYDVVNRRLPAGLVPLVERHAPPGVAVDIIDVRNQPALLDDPDLSWLRDYQADAVTRALTRTRGLLWLPTGAGKTEIAVALALSIQGSSLFLVHRKNLAAQAAARYTKRTGWPVNVIAEGVKPHRIPTPFTCATFQSLAKLAPEQRRQLLHSAHMLMVDEAHTVPADTFHAAVMDCPAYWRFGLSGTPLARSDRRSLNTIAALGPVIFRIKPQELIDRGLLAQPTIKMRRCEQESHAARFNTVYKHLIVQSPERNALVLEMLRDAAKPSMLFVKHVPHGKALVACAEREGLNVRLVDGRHSNAQRDTAVVDLERGALDAIVCTSVFQEGVDVPDLRSVVVATGGKSAIAALQRIGRGMRAAVGKDGFEVWDVFDQGNKWLAKHARARRNAYQRDGHTVEVL